MNSGPGDTSMLHLSSASSDKRDFNGLWSLKALYVRDQSQEQNSVSFSDITCGCSSHLLGKDPRHTEAWPAPTEALPYSNPLIMLSASFICLCCTFLNAPVNYFSQLTIRDKGCSFNLHLHLFPSPPFQLAMEMISSLSPICQPACTGSFRNTNAWRRLQCL